MKKTGNLLHNSTNLKQDRKLDFYQIDNFYAVAEDGCVFQIINKNELFDKNNEFTGDFNNALIYQDNNDSIVYNYAEDCEIKNFMKNNYLFNELDEDLLEKYNNEYTNDSVLSIIRDIHEQGKENILNEFIYILIDSLIKD